ncbi:stage II sporulation protein D [Gorillibacterium timonense]|uniref:stage II sporulation protein D n=1 Tax=Gorillibacterium timonense TaxID=1689269 RepID=UPI00071C7708|nr:stage II sporulation protein D [Gorillibacterium timonense]
MREFPAGRLPERIAAAARRLLERLPSRARLPLLNRLRLPRVPRLVVFTGSIGAPASPAGRPETAMWRVRRPPSLPRVCLGIALFAAFSVVTIGLLQRDGAKAAQVSADPESSAHAAAPQSDPTKASSGAATKPGPAAAPLDTKLSLVVPVYLSKAKTIERLPIEDYVLGVVAAEMPADFAPEALKAQALAARTYIVRRHLEEDYSGVPDKAAWVTDTVLHQAYLTEAQMKKAWGDAYEEKRAKLRKAVEDTAGQIITYSGRPINAVFFSVGNGYTENAEEYWNVSEPYLKSVPSPWDKEAPGYRMTMKLTKKQLVQKLGLSGQISANSAAASMKVTERTTGNRVGQLTIGTVSFSGREIREKLGLRSSSFTWTVKGNQIEFTTFGNGHGVGMSQWGANGMAQEGKTAQEIIAYYYKGVQIEAASLALASSLR